MDCIEIRRGKDSIIVERKLANTVVDRYNTTDLRKAPKRIAPWMLPIIKAGNEVEGIEVVTPPAPPIEPNIFEREAALKAENEALRKQVEQLLAQPTSPCHDLLTAAEVAQHLKDAMAMGNPYNEEAT